MHERRYTPARANPQSLEHLRIFLQQELDKISQAFMFTASSGGEATTVSDTSSINLTLTGVDITADAIFGTTAGTVAEGNHTHAGGGLTQAQALALGLGA